VGTQFAPKKQTLGPEQSHPLPPSVTTPMQRMQVDVPSAL
jgi:hypothetical protein